LEDLEDNWTEELEKQYWAAQSPDTFVTPKDLKKKDGKL
jgi:hypothetical protein